MSGQIIPFLLFLCYLYCQSTIFNLLLSTFVIQQEWIHVQVFHIIDCENTEGYPCGDKGSSNPDCHREDTDHFKNCKASCETCGEMITYIILGYVHF